MKKGKQAGWQFPSENISWYFTTRTHLKNIPGVRNLGKLRHRPVGSCISSPESVTSRPMIRKLQCDALERHQRLPKLLVHLWMAPVQGCSTNPDIRRLNLKKKIEVMGEKKCNREFDQKYHWQPNCTCSMQTWHWEKMQSHLHNCTAGHNLAI